MLSEINKISSRFITSIFISGINEAFINKLISIHNMNYWKECLPSGSFFQTHRSFIVNFLHIKEFDHSLVYLDKRLLTAYLTRRKYHPFKDAYLLYLENLR